MNEDGSVTSASTDGSQGSSERERAHLRAFQLVVDVQSAVPGAAEEIGELLSTAQRKGWPEVVRAALFAHAVAARAEDPSRRLTAVQRLLTQSERDGAPVMIALGLAMRAGRLSIEEKPELATTAEDDLARASILLEASDGSPMERIAAHNACAQAYCERWLWELGDEQYAAALRLGPAAPPDWRRYVLPAIVYNRAEMQVTWACVQRQLCEEAGALAQRTTTFRAAMDAADDVGMPERWRAELDALGALLHAMAGEDPGDLPAAIEAVRPEDHPGAWPVGWLRLAQALSFQQSGRLAEASEAVESAISEINPRGSGDAYDLALCIAAELDSQDGHSGGLRYARRQLNLRWQDRLTVLSSMRGRLQGERLRREHDVMTQQAHLDDLTGLSNRRGFARYLESIERQGVRSIALLLVDVDHFKSVNDRYGHSIGDTVLITVGRLLEGHVRQVDCAVRLGGDEFALVLASMTEEIAQRRAESLLDAVKRQPWGNFATDLAITISVGLAVGAPADFPTVMKQADQALYRAKATGRGRVVLAGSPLVAS